MLIKWINHYYSISKVVNKVLITQILSLISYYASNLAKSFDTYLQPIIIIIEKEFFIKRKK